MTRSLPGFPLPGVRSLRSAFNFFGRLGLLAGCLGAAPAFAAAVQTTTVLTTNASIVGATPTKPGYLRLTLTAHVTAVSGTVAVAPGQVVFCDATTVACAQVGTVQLQPLTVAGASYGTASLTISPPEGAHKYVAIFYGTPSFVGSSSVAVPSNASPLVPTSTTLSSTGSAGDYTLNATFLTGSGAAPTGQIQFTDTTTTALLGTEPFTTKTNQLNTLNVSQPFVGDNGACSIVAADFNNDGVEDVAVGAGCQAPVSSVTTQGAVQILLGTSGEDQFKAAPTPGGFVNIVAGALATGDFNNDGIPDLIVATNQLVLLTGKGDGTFTSSTISTSLTAANLSAGDFNGDGNEDIAVANSGPNSTGGSVQILLGDGAGGFSTGSSTSFNAYPYSMVVGDFTGDGHPDLAINDSTGDSTSPIIVLLNNGSGSFTVTQTQSIPGNIGQIAVGDVNGDGPLDLVTASYVAGSGNNPGTGLVQVLLGDGAGGFSAPVSTATTAYVDQDGTSLSVADVDADGKADVELLANNTAILMLANADGTLRTVDTNVLDTPDVPDYFPSVAGDFNGDGIPDFFASNSDKTTGNFLSTNFLITAQAQLTNVALPGSGTHTVTATYTGDTYNATSTSSPNSLLASQAATKLTIQAAPTSITSGQQVLLTAALSPYNSGTLSTDGETVTFYNGSTKLGTGTLTTGVATLNTTSITATTNSMTASYAGDANFVGSNATATTITVGSASVPLSPATLIFPSTYKGSTSAAQTLTFTNTTGAALPIVGVQTTGDFAQTNNCGTSLAASASCAIQVTFTPTASDSRSGTATVQVTPSNQSATASLTGTGVVAPPTFTPRSLDFGDVVVGVAGTPQVVTVTMVATTNITSVSAPAGFTVLSSCAGAYVLGQSCQLHVNFIPTTAGPASGNIQIAYDAGTEIIPVSGTGTAPSVPTVSPISLNFPATTVGSTAPTQTFTITNTSTGPLTLTSIVSQTTGNSAAYSATYACSNTIPVGGSCVVTVKFQPTSTGTITGVVFVNDDASTPQQSVTLTGTGAAAAPGLSPTSLNFANTTVGITSAAQMMTFTNGTVNAIPVSAVQATGDFAQTNNCGSSIAAGSNCTISVTFTPTTTGQRSGSLTVGLTPANLSPVAALTGTGIPVVPTVPTLSPASLSFGSQTVGAATAAQTVTLKNTAAVSLTVSSIAATGDFSQTNTCGSSVAAGGSCTISVIYTPSTTGNATGTLTIVDNASTSTQTVALTGTGLAPTVGITPPTPPSGGTFTVGTSGSTTITIGITPPPAFTGGVLVTCKVILKGSGTAANQPACKLAPSTVNVTNGSSGTTVLMVTTGTSTTGALERFERGTGIALAGTVLIVAGSFKRKWRGALLALLCSVMLGFAVGCGGGGSSSSTTSTGSGTATPAGSYTITVAATAGTTTSSVDVPLTVQ